MDQNDTRNRYDTEDGNTGEVVGTMGSGIEDASLGIASNPLGDISANNIRKNAIDSDDKSHPTSFTDHH